MSTQHPYSFDGGRPAAGRTPRTTADRLGADLYTEAVEHPEEMAVEVWTVEAEHRAAYRVPVDGRAYLGDDSFD